MNLITVIVLAMGLCFDSFAVSLSHGITQCGERKLNFFRFSLILAFFQGMMPLVGWLLVGGFQQYIQQVDHWIAFALLSFLGVRMILESRKKDESEEPDCRDFDLKRTLVMGIATSVDALIAGAAMGMVTLEVARQASQFANMIVSSGIILLVTFAACVLGVFLGRSAGSKMGEYAELAGGIILIAIGAKVLIEHLLEVC